MSLPIETLCEKCGAEPGQRCVGKYGRERVSFHRGRGSRAGVPKKYKRHAHAIESQLEDALAGALAAWMDHHDVAYATVSTQAPLSRYRLDMLVEVGERRLAVECDGAEFHSSAKAVEHDKRRDRFCATQGIAVMRFTGAEINRDARGCAAQIGLWIRAQR